MAQQKADAKIKDKTITLDDVKNWYSKNVQQNTKAAGENSYVAKKPMNNSKLLCF